MHSYNVHFKEQFYAHRKNLFTDTCGCRLFIPPCSNIYEKKCTKKLNLFPKSLLKRLVFIFFGIHIQKTFLNVHRSIRILSIQLSRNFVFECKFKIHSKILDKLFLIWLSFLQLKLIEKIYSVVKYVCFV